MGLYNYYSAYNIFPELNDKNIAQIFFESSNNFFDIKKKVFRLFSVKKNKLVEFDKKYITNVLR